jgi:hypothetical protein
MHGCFMRSLGCLLPRARPTLAACRVLLKALSIRCYVSQRNHSSLQPRARVRLFWCHLVIRYRILPGRRPNNSTRNIGDPALQA